MLFHVRMNVEPPRDLSSESFEALKVAEREASQALQRLGEWRHLWRIAGHYANVSVFDVESVERLHAILLSLPLFPFMHIEVTPLCRHPSSIRDDDR